MAESKSGGIVGGVVAVIVLIVVLGHGCGGSSGGGGASRPDWCLLFDKAAGQMQNIADGASNGTATITDEAGFFGQLAGDLSDVASVTSGEVNSAATVGSVDAGQVRVRLLSGRGPGPVVSDLRAQMDALSPKCP